MGACRVSYTWYVVTMGLWHSLILSYKMYFTTLGRARPRVGLGVVLGCCNMVRLRVNSFCPFVLQHFI